MNTRMKTRMKNLIPIILLVFIVGATGCVGDDPEINKKDVVITWEDPADIVFGTPLGASQLNATASAMGDFVYSPPAGTILEVGDNQELTVDFTPSDTDVYNNATKTVSINVLKANKTDVVISWSNPEDIEYGTSLGASQLNATASTSGTFTYTPTAGTILEVGNNQNLTVKFTPYDTVNYNTATKTVVINVLKAKSWILSQTIVQWIEPYKESDKFTYPEDVPWNVVFSYVDEYGTTRSTVFTGKEFNVTRTKTTTEANGNSSSGSKTDTWTEPPTEMKSKQEYTIKMKSTRVNGLGNGMSVTGFGTLDEAMSGYIPPTFNQTAFDWDGEKSLIIKLNAPSNNEDALKKRVLRVNLASGAGGVGTENSFSYLYVYEWK